MFGKKKADAVASEQDVAVNNTATETTKVKKKKNGMSQIFRESVFETVLSDFKNNEQFIHVENGENKYVGLTLDANDVGGLDKKSRRDEAKGSIIECINSSRIKTYITSDLLDEECLIIIPDVMTLAAMDEFSLLTDTPYELCYVDDRGDIELLGVKTTYNEICQILADDGNIDDILGDANDVEDVEVDPILEDAVPSMESTLAENVTAAMADDDVPSEDAISVEDEIPSLDDNVDDIESLDDEIEPLPDEDGSISIVNDQYQAAPQNVEYDVPAQEMPMEQPVEDEVENEIPADWTQETLMRKFYADDLGLEVTTDPFDAQFMVNNTFVRFDENRPEGWINNHLNEMAREANDEMERLHQNNLFLMRERYFRLISMQCDRIVKDLDVNNPETQYGQMKYQMQEDHVESVNDIDALTAQQKDELEIAWKQKLQEVGIDAAREAQRKYRERYGSQHEQKIYELRQVIQANVEAEYQYQLHDLNERRRTEASQLLDLGITEVLDEVADMYVSAVEDERVRYKELQENMRVFRDDNLQNDIARSNALAEDLRQNNRADQVLAEQTAKIRSLTDEYNQKKKDLNDEISKLRADNQARLDEMRADNQKDLNRERADREKLQDQYNELLRSYENLDEKKNREFEARMNTMKDEIGAWEEKFDHVVEVHKKNNIISTFLVVAAVIAAVAIGFIGGEYVNSSRSVKQQTQAIQQSSTTTTTTPSTSK